LKGLPFFDLLEEIANLSISSTTHPKPVRDGIAAPKSRRVVIAGLGRSSYFLSCFGTIQDEPANMNVTTITAMYLQSDRV
jgi:hypothetical protein